MKSRDVRIAVGSAGSAYLPHCLFLPDGGKQILAKISFFDVYCCVASVGNGCVVPHRHAPMHHRHAGRHGWIPHPNVNTCIMLLRSLLLHVTSRTLLYSWTVQYDSYQGV